MNDWFFYGIIGGLGVSLVSGLTGFVMFRREQKQKRKAARLTTPPASP